MGRKKLIRFEENAARENLLEPGKPLYEAIRGRWHEDYFHTQHPITLEVACGRGEYSTGLAMQFPYRNFVGVDVKGDRLWKGSVIAESQNLKNVAFLRAQVEQLEQFFAPGEISEIWIPFPDPRPKDRDEKRRLTSPRYLEMYRRLIQPEGIVHFKTDNADLFAFTLETLKQFPVQELQFTHNLYESDLIRYHFGIQTRFEQKYVTAGSPVHYLNFKFEAP